MCLFFDVIVRKGRSGQDRGAGEHKAEASGSSGRMRGNCRELEHEVDPT